MINIEKSLNIGWRYIIQNYSIRNVHRGKFIIQQICTCCARDKSRYQTVRFEKKKRSMEKSRENWNIETTRRKTIVEPIRKSNFLHFPTSGGNKAPRTRLLQGCKQPFSNKGEEEGLIRNWPHVDRWQASSFYTRDSKLSLCSDWISSCQLDEKTDWNREGDDADPSRELSFRFVLIHSLWLFFFFFNILSVDRISFFLFFFPRSVFVLVFNL